MRWPILIGLLFGGGLFTALIVWYGAADILAGVVAIGWGILLVSLFRFAILVFDMLSWHVLLPREKRVPVRQLFWIRWVADSVNTLLPVARIGGEFLRALLLHRRGVAGAVAGASVMVDVTAGILTPFLKLARLMERFTSVQAWTSIIGGAAALDAAVIALYRQRRATTLCCFWRIVGWVAGTGEVWLILMLLGHPVSLTEAFVLESLGQAARSAGFMVPGGLGIQEGGFLLIGSHIGLTPELALSLSLIKRGRELIIGIPGLIAWQIAEGRGLWRRRDV